MRAVLSGCLVQVPTLPLPSCVILGKSLKLSVPHFPHLFKRAADKNDTSLLGSGEDLMRTG